MDEVVAYAGFWRRLSASLLDSLIVGVVTSAVSLINTAPIVNFIVFVLALAYYIYFIGNRGQTPGKMALKIKVVREGYAQVGFVRAAVREVVGKFVSGLVLGVGYLWMIRDGKKQTWHDKMAGTVVVRV